MECPKVASRKALKRNGCRGRGAPAAGASRACPGPSPARARRAARGTRRAPPPPPSEVAAWPAHKSPRCPESLRNAANASARRSCACACVGRARCSAASTSSVSAGGVKSGSRLKSTCGDKHAPQPPGPVSRGAPGAVTHLHGRLPVEVRGAAERRQRQEAVSVSLRDKASARTASATRTAAGNALAQHAAVDGAQHARRRGRHGAGAAAKLRGMAGPTDDQARPSRAQQQRSPSRRRARAWASPGGRRWLR